jgi:hypothetical protein
MSSSKLATSRGTAKQAHSWLCLILKLANIKYFIKNLIWNKKFCYIEISCKEKTLNNDIDIN